MIAGCAYTSQSVRGRKAEDELAEKIARLELQCEEKAVQDTNAGLAGVADRADPLAEVHTKMIEAEGNRKVEGCRATADHENAKITQREIEEYELQGQQERERSAFMATLTASRIP